MARKECFKARWATFNGNTQSSKMLFISVLLVLKCGSFVHRLRFRGGGGGGVGINMYDGRLPDL